MTKKLVFKLQVHDEKAKKKALKRVSGLSGIESLAMDMNDKKLTLVGDVDPVEVVCKLKKNWHTELLTVGPAKESDKKKEEEKKADPAKLEAHYYPYTTHYHPVYSIEENPNSCVIF